MHNALEAVMHSAPRATGALLGLLRSLMSAPCRLHVRRSPCMVCTPPSCVVERGGRTMASLHPDPSPHSPSPQAYPQAVPRSPPNPPLASVFIEAQRLAHDHIEQRGLWG